MQTYRGLNSFGRLPITFLVRQSKILETFSEIKCLDCSFITRGPCCQQLRFRLHFPVKPRPTNDVKKFWWIFHSLRKNITVCGHPISQVLHHFLLVWRIGRVIVMTLIHLDVQYGQFVLTHAENWNHTYWEWHYFFHTFNLFQFSFSCFFIHGE